MWKVAYWLVKKMIPKSNAPDLFWLIEELNGTIGKQNHSVPSITKCIIVIGLLIKTKWIDFIRIQDFFSFGCDTVDIKYALKVIIMYFRVLIRGEPRNVFFGIRNELGASGEQLFTYIKDAVSGRDLEYGYDIRRKVKMEYEAKMNENENINRSKSGSLSSIVSSDENVNDDTIYSQITRDVLNIIANDENGDESNQINNNNSAKQHPMDCYCQECLLFAFEPQPQKKQRLMNDENIDDMSKDDDIILSNNNNNNSNDIVIVSNVNANAKAGSNATNGSKIVENNNNSNNINICNDKKDKKKNVPFAIQILRLFIGVMGKRALTVGEKHTLAGIISLLTDGGSNYWGRKVGLHGQVMFCYTSL